MIAPREPFYAQPETEHPPLTSLTSLTPLQGYVSAIHASSFFHLFDEIRQLELARRLGTLLSPVRGSTIFGFHGGRPEKGLRMEALNSAGKYMFCHSPDSWTGIVGWSSIQERRRVEVECGLQQVERKDLPAAEGAKFYGLWWSVTRL